MIIWIDAQLSPSLALWINQTFDGIKTQSVRSIGLRNASDKEIFRQAGLQSAVIMSKDDDFVKLLQLFGPPPQIIWFTCGNTSNFRMREILNKHLPTIIKMIKAGNELVEVSGE